MRKRVISVFGHVWVVNNIGTGRYAIQYGLSVLTMRLADFGSILFQCIWKAASGSAPCTSEIRNISILKNAQSSPKGPRVVSFVNMMRSAIAVTLSASSRHRMVACGIPNALTGSPGIAARSISTRGSSHLRSSSACACACALSPGVGGFA
jgi:hypothetical protein